MIPYPESFIAEIGDWPLTWFGVLVATGVLLGTFLAEWHGRKMGLDKQDVRWLATRTVIGGFLVSHVFDVLAYTPEKVLEDPWVLVTFWSGLSSFGGFLGAAITFVWLTRREKLPALVFADAIALGLAPAWVFGRAGCFTAHDHPGFPSDFFLAVAYPDGARHDLGFYEMLVTVGITVVLYAYARRRRGPGALVGLLAALYGPPRFLLDFLRERETGPDVSQVDPRYVGLTPGQWASIACLLVGLYFLARAKGQPPYAPPGPADAEAETVDDSSEPP